jgi:hypothetical protein
MARNEYGRTSITEGNELDHGWIEEARSQIQRERIELVFDIVDEFGPVTQHAVTLLVEDLLGVVRGTAASIVSTALLILRLDEMVEHVGSEPVESGRPSNLWRVAQ